MEYTKQTITLVQQIETLKQRGLLIENEEEAKNALDTISYFRLAGYWRLHQAIRTICYYFFALKQCQGTVIPTPQYLQ